MIRALIKRMINGTGRELSTPPAGSAPEITALLRSSVDGDRDKRSQLITLLYPELKRIAGVQMSRERIDHTLQPTALVNEFFLEFAKQEHLSWNNRAHFLAAASQAMKRILIDHWRSASAEKRGGGGIKLQLGELDLPENTGMVDSMELQELLDRLTREEPRMAEILELRCFGGLTHAEIAEIIGVDERTVKRDWQIARAWLYGHLKKRRSNVS